MDGSFRLSLLSVFRLVNEMERDKETVVLSFSRPHITCAIIADGCTAECYFLLKRAKRGHVA